MIISYQLQGGVELMLQVGDALLELRNVLQHRAQRGFADELTHA
jgi:hypothetical protein